MKRKTLSILALFSIPGINAQITGESAESFVGGKIVGFLDSIVVSQVNTWSDFVAFILLPVLGLYAVSRFLTHHAFLMAEGNFSENTDLGTGGDELSDIGNSASRLISIAIAVVGTMFYGGFSLLVVTILGFIGVLWFIWQFWGATIQTAWSPSTPDFGSSTGSAVEQLQEELAEEESKTEGIEDDVEKKEEDIEEGSSGGKEKEAEIALKELEKVAELLRDEESKIDRILDIEEEELEDALEKAENIGTQRKKARKKLEQIDENLDQILWNSLSIDGANFGGKEGYGSRAERYLEDLDLLRHDLEHLFSIREEAVKDHDLAAYRQTLEEAMKLTRFDMKGEQIDFAELEDIIDQHRKTLKEFRELKKEIKEALEEEKELEKIMNNLGDEEVWRREGKKLEDELVKIRNRFQEAKKKEEDIEELEKQIENFKKNDSGVQKLQELAKKIEKREKIIELIENDLATRKRIKDPWQLVAKNPDRKDFWAEKNSKNLEDGWFWTGEWIYNKGANLPEQGWKIHVAVTPEDEAEVLKVAKAIMPVLKGIKSERKFAVDGEHLMSKGGETRVKLATIYPMNDSNPPDHVNQNKKTTEDILRKLIQALQSENLLGASEKVKTIGEFQIMAGNTPTRIFVRYDKLGGEKVHDIEGNAMGGRKPGVVPPDFIGKNNIDVSKYDIKPMKGLKSLDFTLNLPKDNFYR